MRPHHLLPAVMLALCPLSAVAYDAPVVDPRAIRAHVEFLADDLLEGRATGSRGFDIAARYVATQFELVGLEPGGVDGTWLQPVSLTEATRVIPAATAAIELDGQRTELVPGEDFIPGFGYFGSLAEVSGPLVFVGHAITAPELGYDDFAGVDVTGKIAVVLSGAPASFPNSQRAHYSREKVRELVRRGAIGMVWINTPSDEKRSPWAKSVQLSWVPSMRLLDAAGEPVDAYPQIKASMSLNLAAADKLFAGSPVPLEEIWSQAEAGILKPFDLPATLTLRTRSAQGKAESNNVIGLLPGSDPVLKNEYVVFSAHLDHIGRGAAVNGDTIYNGALDNASGIAVMIEAARVLAAARQRPKRSILFVAVTAEERGLLGSKHFAMNPTVPKDAIVANVNMDMPVVLYPAAGFTAFGAEHSTLGAVAEKALEAEGLIMAPDPTPEEVIFVRSDQYSFVREGIPAIYLDDGKVSSDPNIDALQIFRNHMLVDYHMPSDEIDLPINWDSMAALARVNVRIARLVADDPVRPSWLPGDFFGETFGKR